MQDSVSSAHASAIGELFAQAALDARRIEVGSETVLIGADQPADKVYYILEGQVRTYQVGPDGSGRLIDILGPGDWFGAAALAGQVNNSVQAVTATESVILEAAARQVLGLLAEQPQLGVELVRQLALKLQAAHEDAARLVFDDCNLRLLKTLMRFSRSAAASVEGDEVVLRITHYQLAQAVGVARETISLALTQLRHQKLLRTGRNQLIFNPADLGRLAVQQQIMPGNGLQRRPVQQAMQKAGG